ncbi:hypothetical protein K458DRAFT_382496 [Lentithecium fluviatile CBS 122367]|uniref:Uncharacterized protein n=1 Tax=Lentithecium fluviatile CBS 122367 TaxID=1168545 RepID=A0A6G1JK26_9PLEO|nr:hypothetical protein K458DRAFT_382496 [Lentithecium fluviatile CBS 122367]
MDTEMESDVPTAALSTIEPNQQLQNPLLKLPNCGDDTSTQPSIFPFMDLPKELRLQIYSYFSNTTYKPIDTVRPRRLPYWTVTLYHPSILRSRTIHDEAMNIANDRQPAAVFIRLN